MGESRRSTAAKQAKNVPVEDYQHGGARRTNNPPVGLAHLDREETPTRRLAYDPHLDPQLLWAGKVERAEAHVPAPSVHVHEELTAKNIISSVRRQRSQTSLFDVDELDPAAVVEFYQHELNWSNRMILGDSLTVMVSLLERERLAGKVQCCYIDPPYGVNYNSNFQPRITDRQVRDGRDEDLTREPEMIQAYRDTWELGVHSYLSYLRDRLTIARELLTDTGSVFVQIGPDNLHLVKAVLDEVFGADNAITTITMQKTSQVTSKLLPEVTDFLCWYAKDKEQVKYRQLFEDRRGEVAGEGAYRHVESPDGTRRLMSAEERTDPSRLAAGSRVFQYGDATSQGYSPHKTVDFEFNGHTFHPGSNRHWLLRIEGMQRLAELGRLEPVGNTLRYIRYADEAGLVRRTNVWTDTGQAGYAQRAGSRYVVETNPKAVARCLMMATDPGDLVLDPTCGSGTTAAVAEQYGRRWITIDTSRVALAIARERLLTATYPYYTLRDETRDVDGGFVYETVPWVRASALGYDEQGFEEIPLYDQPQVDSKKTRVSGPFTLEALSRYNIDPFEEAEVQPPRTAETADHVEVLLDALKAQGIPRPGAPPVSIQTLTPLAASGPLQAEGLVDLAGRQVRFAVSLGPQFGMITMAQVAEALRHAIGFDLVVFAGFAVSAEAQEKLANGRIGSTDVALLLANPDLLVGDLLKNTSASQTFRLYAAPDVHLEESDDGYIATLEGVDSYDAATGQVVSYGKAGIQAWFLDDDYDGTVFRATQAFFPVTDAWQRLRRALKGTVDADLVDQLHGWNSLPFTAQEHNRIAVRVIANDGNAAETVLDLPGASS
jgi:adenine-specific DNA-methyltransferase